MLKAAQSYTKSLCQLHSNFPHLQLVLAKEKWTGEESWKSEQHQAARYFLSVDQDLYCLQLLFPFLPIGGTKQCLTSKILFFFFSGAKEISEVSSESRQRRKKPLKWNTTHWNCWDTKILTTLPSCPSSPKKVWGRWKKKKEISNFAFRENS